MRTRVARLCVQLDEDTYRRCCVSGQAIRAQGAHLGAACQPRQEIGT